MVMNGVREQSARNANANRQRVLIVAKPGRPHAWLSTNDGTGGTIGPVQYPAQQKGSPDVARAAVG